MTVVYIDSVFFLNTLMDYLLVLSAGRLAGIPLRRGRYMLAALAGGAYAAAVFLPGLGFLAAGPVKLAAGVLLSLIAFGGEAHFFRLTLLLFSIFLMAFLNFLISARISNPILRLERSIRELDKGLAGVKIEEGGCYEVQRLNHAVASMVSTMRHLMDDIVRQEGEKRRSELEVLQSQINPHFLYNTLDSVIWMTESGQQTEAIQMVTSLARLFRISLSKGKSIIPLADELEHARHYMNIQQIRYKNKFTTEIEARPGTEGLYTLKLIIQPLLENAIYHGMASAEDDGLIRVTAYREGEDLLIDVEDNGLGMRPELAASLLDEDRPEVRTKGSGIGVRNVHQRVGLTFGEGYGLAIFSEPDEGTLVRIRLPALDREEAERRRQGEEL